MEISGDTTSEDDFRRELFGELSPSDTEPAVKAKKEIKVKPVILTPEFVPPPL